MPNENKGPFVLVQTLRREDTFGCKMLGIFSTEAKAKERMTEEYQKSITEWPDGDHKIEATNAYTFDGDIWDWTSWNHWAIFDASSKHDTVWF